MHPNDKAAFAQLMTTIAQLCKSAVSTTDLKLYWHCLQDFSFAQVEEALTACLRNPNRQWGLPTIADIAGYWVGNPKTQALTAWSKVAKAISEVGRYASIVFDDAGIHAVITDMGGWIALGDLKLTQWPFYQREFLVRYEAFVLHPPQHYPKVLMGLCARKNGYQGYAAPSPKLYGDAQKALKVYQQGQTPTQQFATLDVALQSGASQ